MNGPPGGAVPAAGRSLSEMLPRLSRAVSYPEKQALLSVAGASKSFGSLRAVDDVGFEVIDGEVFGIAGPNGAGKTTLFNMITGIPFHADSGTIRFDGRDITREAPHRIFRAGVARTFQKEACFDSLTVDENLRVAAAFGGHAAKESSVKTTISEVLERSELTADRNRLARVLPLYAKKRLMLAAALVANPRLIMLDEPGAGLNAIELDQMRDVVLELKRAGITVIVIEHVLALLFGISDRLMIMDYGKKIAEGPPEQVARDDRVIEAYLGQRGAKAFHALGH